MKCYTLTFCRSVLAHLISGGRNRFAVSRPASSRKAFVDLLSLTAILLMTCGILSAQVTRGTITGRISDPSGAVIPGAHVEIVQTDTGTKTYLVTNKQGEYTAPYLAPGPYNVTITATGFETFLRSGLVLETEQTLTIDAKLAMGRAEGPHWLTSRTRIQVRRSPRKR